MLSLAACASQPVPPGHAPFPSGPGILLEDLSWVESERVLTPDAVIVIPLGAESKEHGPHLKLRNDWTLAEYFKRRIAAATRVVVAPTINYNYFPAFVEYPGSTTLSLTTSRDMIVDICRSLARHGPRRIYILNTGVSTLNPLRAAQAILAKDSVPVVMHFTDVLKLTADLEKTLAKQEGGTHADELETSMMLYIDPASVDMSKAVKDYHPGTGRLSRTERPGVTYSPSGIWGDATLATREKGEVLVEAMVKGMLAEIDALRRTPVP
jgi:creatinine amidohydrolase